MKVEKKTSLFEKQQRQQRDKGRQSDISRRDLTSKDHEPRMTTLGNAGRRTGYKTGEDTRVLIIIVMGK